MRSRRPSPSWRRSVVAAVVIALAASWSAAAAAQAQLSQSYYASTCPNVETLVRGAVTQKLQETFNAAPGTLRLFFHDCFVRVRALRSIPFHIRHSPYAQGSSGSIDVPRPCLTLVLLVHSDSQGCDASVLLSGPDDEHSAGADTTLSPDALDLVTRAKAAVDADPKCAYKVSCADILALAARDVVSQVLYFFFFRPPIHPRFQAAGRSYTRTPPTPVEREFVGAVVSVHVTFGATDEQRGWG